MPIPTYCRLCEGTCGLIAEVESDRLVGLRGDPSDPVSEGFVCQVAQESPRALRHPERVRTPLRRVGGELVPASWEEAVADIGERLRAVRGQSGASSLALYLGDAVQRSSSTLLRALAVGVGLGTPNIFSTLCSGQGPALRATELVVGHPMHLLSDLGRAHFVILLGNDPDAGTWGAGNPGMAHEAWIEHSRKTKGTKVVVADPRKTRLAADMDQHLAIRPGTDLFFLLGMCSAILRGGWTDAQYLRDYAKDVEALEDLLAPWTVERCAEICGVPAAQLSGVALKFSRAAMGVIHPGPGTFQGGHGLVAAWAWLVVHTLTANTLRPGGLYEHVGVFDLHLALSAVPTATAPRTRVSQHPLLLLQAPATALAEEVLTPGEGQVRALICVGGDPVADLPETAKVREALGALDLLVCLSRTLDGVTDHADWVLPLTHPWEEEELRLLDSALLPAHLTQKAVPLVAPEGEARTADAVLRELFAQVRPGLRGSAWGTHLALLGRVAAKADLDQWVGNLTELLGNVDLEQLDQPPHRLDLGDTNRAQWRVTHSDKRLHLAPPGMGELLAQVEPPRTTSDLPLFLRTSAPAGRAPDAHHRVGEDPGLRVHPDLGIPEGAEVEVRTRFGSLRCVAHLDEGLRPDSVDLPRGASAEVGRLLSAARADRGTGAPEADGLACRVTPC